MPTIRRMTTSFGKLRETRAFSVSCSGRRDKAVLLLLHLNSTAAGFAPTGTVTNPPCHCAAEILWFFHLQQMTSRGESPHLPCRLAELSRKISLCVQPCGIFARVPCILCLSALSYCQALGFKRQECNMPAGAHSGVSASNAASFLLA